MIKSIKKRLLSGFDIENNPLLYRRITVTAALMLLVAVAGMIFVPINLYFGRYQLVLIDLTFVLTSLAALYLLFFKNQLEAAAFISVSVFFVVILFFIATSNNNDFELIWTIVFPLFSIPIFGKKKGLMIILLFYAVLTPMVYSGLGQWDHGQWSPTSFLRFAIVSSACIFSAYFFESSSVRAYKVIEATLQKEKRLLKQLEKLSTTDQLTGLNNRRYFDSQFKLEVQKVKRFSSDLSLMMLDIDHFKKINDRYGHPVGDRVLKEFSQLLQLNIRVTDILSRWGGEEFVILMPQISISNAAILAEKTRSMIKNHSFKIIGQLTVSIGITSVHPNSKGENDAMIKVDKALYSAKRAGRDQVAVSD